MQIHKTGSTPRTFSLTIHFTSGWRTFRARIWAPAQQGEQRETKWFYERARGQYIDAQSKLTLAEQKRFKAEYPKSQMFTKTDLAKFENVFDDHPRFVNLGGQKNFARYALRIWKRVGEIIGRVQ